MVGLDRNKHAGSLSNAKRNVQIQVKTGLLGAYEENETQLTQLRRLLDEGEQSGLSDYYYDDLISQLEKEAE